MSAPETYMHRCLELACRGQGRVAPNPMVGAVLLHEDRIIGEGYHQVYGEAHAEVKCLNAVSEEDRKLIPESTMYVSLEPCSHYGKTPPCADRIIAERIPRVVIGCRDPFPAVNGSGIEKLQQAGISVQYGVLEQECLHLNRRFFTFHTQHRPYIVLKWAQTLDGRIASHSADRLMITNAFSNRLVHQWRSREMGIVAGTNTIEADDPELTTRLWPGPQPVRIIVDRELRLSATQKVFDGQHPTVVFNLKQHSLPFERIGLAELREAGVSYYQISDDASTVQQMLNGLYRMNIQSILVEGGARLLQSFIDENAWDEARVLCNTELTVGEGLSAPVLKNHCRTNTINLQSDQISFFVPNPAQA